MNTKLHRVATLAIACSLALGTSHALAQAAKPAAAKPGAADPGKRRGPGDRIMTKDELRACTQLKASNDAGTAEIARRQELMSKERSDLAAAPDPAGSAKAEVEQQLKAVEQADAAVREHAKAVEDWNTRMAEFEAKSKDMRNADRRRTVLRQEQLALKAAEQKLVTDRNEKVAVYERGVTAANEAINNNAGRNADWNKRNEELAAAEDRLLDARHKWATECSNRRFREEDEIAIKAGK
jgi:hypothetical protein